MAMLRRALPVLSSQTSSQAYRESPVKKIGKKIDENWDPIPDKETAKDNKKKRKNELFIKVAQKIIGM